MTGRVFSASPHQSSTSTSRRQGPPDRLIRPAAASFVEWDSFHQLRPQSLIHLRFMYEAGKMTSPPERRIIAYLRLSAWSDGPQRMNPVEPSKPQPGLVVPALSYETFPSLGAILFLTPLDRSPNPSGT